MLQLFFAAGQRPAGGGVGEVGGDGGDQPGPFAVPPGPLIQDGQALQAADRRVPQPVGAGEVQGMQQVGFLGPQRCEDLGCAALGQPG